MRIFLLCLMALGCLLLSGAACATEYHVGSGQQYATINDLLLVVTLGDNDIVWVHPGNYPNFWVKAGGGSSQAAEVQIKAFDPNNKPVFNAAGANNCAQFEDPESVFGLVGKWFSIENLEITGAASRGIYNVSCNIIARHCYVHNNNNGYMGGWHNARDAERGDAIFEYNEFYQNGGGAFAHQLYLEGYNAEYRYNWLHDPTGGISFKDRSRNSIMEYNYVAAGGAAGYRAFEFCGYDDNQMPDIDQYATVTGNVITQNGGLNPWLFFTNERTEGGSGRNVGYMTMTNNTCYATGLTGPVMAGDKCANTTLHNNVFFTNANRMFDKVQGQRTYGVINPSYNNWVWSGTALTNPNMLNSVIGSDPGVVNAAWPLGDFHLTAGSQCINAGINSVGNLPIKEYSHPINWVARASDGAIDIGAYEYGGGAGNPPVANFSGNPTSGAAPLAVAFTDLSTNGPTSWSWTFGDGGTSTAQSPSHVYGGGTFTVSLTAVNPYGSDTETKNSYITATGGGGGGDFFCTTAVSEGGSIQSGDHTSLHVSDNVYLVVNAVKLSGKYGTKMRYTFETGLGSLSSLSITYENHVSVQPQRQRVYMHNYTTGADVLVDDRNITSTSDTTYTVNVSSPAAYRSATGQVQVFIRIGDLSGTAFTLSGDFLKITAAP